MTSRDRAHATFAAHPRTGLEPIVSILMFIVTPRHQRAVKVDGDGPGSGWHTVRA